MIDELLAFSKKTKFEVIFLREQDSFYKDDLEELKSNGVQISIKPFSGENLLKKVIVILQFLLDNILKFRPDYNFVIGFKSIVWFLKFDLSRFSESSSIHAQFATQAALLSYLIKKYFGDKPEYSFTFHAHDIYFKNKWFNLLVKNSKKAFSISIYNINYVKNKFINSDKIVLARLGVFREQLFNDEKKPRKAIKLGLISRFVEKKGIKYLLEAMLELKKTDNLDIKLILAGDGPLKRRDY